MKWNFRLFKREAETYIKTAESGNKRAHSFCPECGTPIYGRFAPADAAEMVQIGAAVVDKLRAVEKSERQCIITESAYP